MAKIFKHPSLRFFLGDVRDQGRLAQAFKGVDYVIHAAALKQVNAAEYNPEEYIKTNVYGAQNIINAAIQSKVLKVIALSTDKASNPINLYGVTKLCADKLFVAGNSLSGLNGTRFSIARYGNVSGSRGSVLPYFKRLLGDKKKYLPITDIRMTRFWITLDKAYDFVCKSIFNMNGGEIFIPKLPSIKIIDLANVLDNKIEKKIIGIQPGEKLHETMFTETDCPNVIEYKDYYIISPSIIFFKKKNNFYKNQSGEKGKILKKIQSYSSNNNNFLSNQELKKIINSKF
jgi:UDP-N-acetylglucosamine 4,6-dehydratase